MPDLKMPLRQPPLRDFHWVPPEGAPPTAFEPGFDPLTCDDYYLKAWFAEWLADPLVDPVDLHERIELLSAEMGRRAAQSYSLRTGMTTVPTAWVTPFRRFLYAIAGVAEPRPAPTGKNASLMGIQWVRHLVAERKTRKARAEAKAHRSGGNPPQKKRRR